MPHVRRFLTLGLLLAASACEQGDLLRPPSTIPVHPAFTRYASVGNSITAGFQSGGINEITQNASYAVLLAGRMRTPFFIPAMNFPGCPSLYTNVFTQTRAAPTIPCALRKPETLPLPYINNVAVPGAEVMDAVANLGPESNANALTLFFLGGMTQMQMLQRVQPTFVTVWIGNNDVLGAATNSDNGGDPALVTPPAAFATRYNNMLAEIAEVAPVGGVLIGVANVVAPANRAGLPPTQPPANGVPYFSYGSTYYVLDQAGQIPGPFTAEAACAPPRGDSVLVPFPVGGALIGAGGTLTCTEVETIQPDELENIVAAVTAYNQTISAAATARGWLYVNPNPVLDALRAIPTEVAFFPAFGADCSANPFGLAFTCDAVHPSASLHRLIANKLIDTLNVRYGTSMAPIP